MGAYDDILSNLNKNAKDAGASGPSYLDSVPGPVRRGFGHMVRGATNALGFLTQADLALDQKQFGHKLLRGLPTEEMTRNAQDAAGIPPRPADAGFGTDVLEDIGVALMVPQGRGLIRTPLTSTTSVAGGRAGEYLGGKFDEKYGTRRGGQVGSFVGSLLGGGLGELPEQGLRAAARKTFGKSGDGSRQAFSTLEEAGITPLPALVGNDRMAKLANSAGNFPIVGGVVQERHQNALLQWQNRLFQTANRLLGGGDDALTQVPGKEVLGGQARIATEAGKDSLNTRTSQGYDDFFANKPRETLVVPNNVDELRARQTDPYTGETAPTNRSVQEFYDTTLDPSMMAPPQGPQRPTGAPVLGGANPKTPMQGPQAPSGAPQSPGVPLDVARKIRSEAFYDAQGNRLVHGAGKQFTGAWTQDISDALMHDPAMVRRFPDPAARMAEVEQLRVLDTEYKMAQDKQVSGAGGKVVGDRMYVGGDVPAFDRILNNTSDESIFNVATKPENMAILQRNAPGHYPGLAAGNLVQRAELPGGRVGPVQLSPADFNDYWSKRGQNQKLILTGERSHGQARSIAVPDPNNMTPEMHQVMRVEQGATPIMNSLDNLSEAGELFRTSGIKPRPSDTTPTLTTMGLLGAALIDPVKAGLTMTIGKGLGHAATSPELARIIAGMDPSFRSVMADQLMASTARQAARDTIQPPPPENQKPY